MIEIAYLALEWELRDIVYLLPHNHFHRLVSSMIKSFKIL